MRAVRLRLLWHPQPQFAGYLLAQHDGFARERDIALDCQPVDFAVGAIDALLDEACEFAVASPAHVVESRAPDEVVMLLTIQQTSSLTYGARRGAGIARARDLGGKTIAVWPGGEDLELRWMLARAGATGARLLPVADTAHALAHGEVDCAQLTVYHEVFELEAQVPSLEPYAFLVARDEGTALLKDGLFARRDWVAAHPELTQRLVECVLAGWTHAFRSPNDAVERCARLRPDLSREHHRRQLHAIRVLAQSGERGLGYPDVAHVDAALAAHAAVEGTRAVSDAMRYVDASFWHASAPALRRVLDR